MSRSQALSASRSQPSVWSSGQRAPLWPPVGEVPELSYAEQILRSQEYDVADWVPQSNEYDMPDAELIDVENGQVYDLDGIDTNGDYLYSPVYTAVPTAPTGYQSFRDQIPSTRYQSLRDQMPMRLSTSSSEGESNTPFYAQAYESSPESPYPPSVYSSLAGPAPAVYVNNVMQTDTWGNNLPLDETRRGYEDAVYVDAITGEPLTDEEIAAEGLVTMSTAPRRFDYYNDSTNGNYYFQQQQQDQQQQPVQRQTPLNQRGSLARSSAGLSRTVPFLGANQW